METQPFSPWPFFGPDEVEAASRVLRSGRVNYWTGEEGRLFEQEFAERFDCRHAVAVANGTVSLELALRALGISPGDEVVVPSRTFIATATSVVMVGATPVMAEVDPDSQNLTAETIRAVLTERTRAVIAVHLAGWPCDMDPILELAGERNLLVIEDCAQAQGARYKGRPVGSMGHASAFSFCQDKIMTTGGEGGMLTTNDDRVWEFAWSFKDHGKSYSAVFHKEHPPGFRWLHESVGTNWRMTEVQAAIGRVGLRKLDSWLQTRRHHAKRLAACFHEIPALRVTRPPADFFHAYYKYYAFVRPEKLRPGWSRDRIMTSVSERGIPCFSGSCSEIYREKAFAGRGIGPESPWPVARELGETSLMFLVHPTLTDRQLDASCRVITEVFNDAVLPS